jgi:hypothetical protein
MNSWDQRPLWWRCYVGPHSRIYLQCGHVIHHTGCGISEFWDKVKKLNFEKYRVESVVNELTRFDFRQPPALRLELTATAKKVLRTILGPAPDDPDYSHWWELRLISVEQMKKEGQAVEFAACPPVPLKPQKKPAPKEPKKAPRKRKKAG